MRRVTVPISEGDLDFFKETILIAGLNVVWVFPDKDGVDVEVEFISEEEEGDRNA